VVSCRVLIGCSWTARGKSNGCSIERLYEVYLRLEHLSSTV